MPAAAQQISIDFDESGALPLRVIQLLGAVTILSIAPGALIMVTCFPFIVTVLGILRQAVGLPSAPANSVVIALALFTTWFVMEPTFNQAWNSGITPYSEGNIPIEAAFENTLSPFRDFMANRADEGILREMLELRPDIESLGNIPHPPLHVLVPSFILSEISRAFQVGFLIFIPFMIIDLIVASVLMAMGMMMVSPVMISLPFKIAFFVSVDGWTLVLSSLVRSYTQTGLPPP